MIRVPVCYPSICNRPAYLHAPCPCSHCAWPESKQAEVNKPESRMHRWSRDGCLKLASESHKNGRESAANICSSDTMSDTDNDFHWNTKAGFWREGVRCIGCIFSKCSLLLLAFPTLPTLALKVDFLRESNFVMVRIYWRIKNLMAETQPKK